MLMLGRSHALVYSDKDNEHLYGHRFNQYSDSVQSFRGNVYLNRYSELAVEIHLTLDSRYAATQIMLRNSRRGCRPPWVESGHF